MTIDKGWFNYNGFIRFSRPSPNKDGGSWKSKPSSSASSFQAFQDSVRDAWDIEDDEFGAMATGNEREYLTFQYRHRASSSQ